MYVGAFPLHLQLHEFLEVQAYFLLFNPLLDWLSLLFFFFFGVGGVPARATSKSYVIFVKFYVANCMG